MRSKTSDIFRNNLYVITSIGLILLFFYPLFFSDKTFYFRDIHRWFFPMKYFLADSVKNGSIPYWCPNIFCGAPFINDIQSGVFYPLSLIFLISPFHKAFNFFILAHLFLGFCFFYLFIKNLGLSKKAAIFTGISYCYGGYVIASINTLNNLTAIIWLPAVLWSFTKGAKGGSPSGYFLCIIFLCMMILGGEPEIFVVSTGLLFLYGLISLSQKGSFKRHIKTSLIILGLVSSALLITIVQLGPTYLDYDLSARMGGISYEEATGYSLTIDMLRHILLPLRFPYNFTTDPDLLKSLFHENGQIPWLLTVYPGFLIAPLALVGIASDLSKKTLFWLLIFIAGIALSLGNYTPIYRLFFKIFPFFRFPAKFMFLATPCLLVLSGYGLDRTLSFLRRINLRPMPVFLFLSSLLIMDLLSANKNLNPICESNFYQGYQPYLKDILTDHDTFRIYTDPEIDIESAGIVKDHQIWQSLLMPNLGILQNLKHIDGTTGLELRYQYIITEILEKTWKEKIGFLRLSNVKYIISLNDLSNIPEIKDKVERINPIVFRIKDYLPRAWIAGQLIPIKNGTVNELMDDSFNPFNSAITKGVILSEYTQPSFQEIKDISYVQNNRIHIKVNAEAPGVLVLSESSYPGWQVFVDGKERDCLWLDLLFQGVEIEKGRHQVDFIYHPKYFRYFLSVSIISVTLLSLIWLYSSGSVRKASARILKHGIKLHTKS
jgi:hypothetical protein